LYKKEDLEGAIEKWNYAIELNPELLEARVFLSKAQTRLRNLQKYGSVIGETTENEKRDEELRIEIKRHYIDGINYFVNELYREAISEWEEVLKIDPKNENAILNIEKAKKRMSFEVNQGS